MKKQVSINKAFPLRLNRIYAALLGLAVAAPCAPLLAGISIKIAPNPSGTLDSSNRNGDATDPACPENFTCLGKGDGSGSIHEETSPEDGWTFNVAAENSAGKYLAYADAGSGDVQVSGEIQNDYGSFLTNNSLLELGIMESTEDSSWYFGCFSPNQNSRLFSVAYGTPGNLTLAFGPTGLSRPGYCAVTYDVSSTTIKGFYCPAGETPEDCTELASVVRSMSDVLWYAGGKSFSSTQPMTGTISKLDFATTISVYTPTDPGETDPVWEMEIPNQGWTAGQAITAIDVNDFCSVSKGSKSFSSSGLPSGISISAGVISGTPSSSGSGTATITCSDGTDTADEVFSWTVTAAGGMCTGDTFQFTQATSLATINAQNVSPGDCVLFQAGGVWNPGTAANVLTPKSGVTYGRYGTGNDPVIDCSGIALGWQGCIDIRPGVTNVTVQDFEVRDVDTTTPNNFGFLIFINAASNITIQRVHAHTSVRGCISFRDSTDIKILSSMVNNCSGRPDEGIAIVNTDGFEVAFNHVFNSGHAAVNIKSGSRNGRAHHNTFEAVTNDPTCYLERSENVEFDHNICMDTFAQSTTLKPLLSIGVERIGECEDKFVRNANVHHNIFWKYGPGGSYTTQIGIVHGDAYDGCTLGNSGPNEQLIHNINFHHNTIVVANTQPESWHAALRVFDARGSVDPTDNSEIQVNCNIFWDTGVGRALLIRDGITPSSYRNNLYQSGETSTPNNGTSPVLTSNVLFVDEEDGDFRLQPGSPAIGACHDGSNIGADDGTSIGAPQ